MKLDHKPKPQVLAFNAEIYKEIKWHAREVRRLFDWPGIPYHDADVPSNQEVCKDADGKFTQFGTVVPGLFRGDKFNRWYWHNLPVLRAVHHSDWFVKEVCEAFGRKLKPSYCFLSMYGPEGVCPLHIDRPQCQFTVDLQIRSDGDWPIYVDDERYLLKDGQALLYSGTGQPHYRKPMALDSTRNDGSAESRATFMDLAFFHFVPVEWQGKVD